QRVRPRVEGRRPRRALHHQQRDGLAVLPGVRSVPAGAGHALAPGVHAPPAGHRVSDHPPARGAGASLEGQVMTVQKDLPTARGDALITVDDVSIGYSGKVAVDKVDLSVQPGEFVSIIGPSGCGKSTLLHLLSGLNEPLRGSVSVRGVDSTGSMGAALKVGYAFQDHRLLPWRTVAQNLDIAMKNAGVPQGQWAERRGRYLSLLHVADHEASFPLRLSGGQRQRVSIARAMAVSPDIVLMDEPFSGLDEVTARSIRRE